MIYDSFRTNNKINDILNSEQFQYSEKIMKFRSRNELNIEQISNLLKITPKEYIEYEYCNLNIPTRNYIDIIKKLKKVNINSVWFEENQLKQHLKINNLGTYVPRLF